MRKILFAIVIWSFSTLCLAESPTQAVEKAVAEILNIAQAKDVADDKRKQQLEQTIESHVDLHAASQRVLALHWRSASDEEKLAFMRVFRKVLTNTYFNLLQQYNNEKVVFKGEEIKREIYAEVSSTVLSQGKEIPVNYRLIKRDDGWKVYDFIAEGISMVRSFSNDYQSILRSNGVAGLTKQLKAKLAESKT